MKTPELCGRGSMPMFRLVRTTRARIIHLRNDYKGLMSRIESGLHAHHASMKDSAAARAAIPAQPATASSSSSTSASQASLLEAPFAKVNSVVSGSPADEAGLKAGDAVRRFGNVNIFNNEKLAKVAETVQRNEGVRIVASLSQPMEYMLNITVAEYCCQGSARYPRRRSGRAAAATDAAEELGRAWYAWMPSCGRVDSHTCSCCSNTMKFFARFLIVCGISCC